MPVEFFDSAKGLRVRQSFDPPTAYLDHWAIRLFSDDQGLQDRVVSALLRKSGTLLLSHFSFAEFATATDPRHCADAEAFLERVLPNVFFTDFRMDEILARESAEPDNTKRFWPTADLPQLKMFAERAQLCGALKMRGFIALTHVNRAAIAATMNQTLARV